VSNSNNSGIVNSNAGDAGMIESAADARYAIPAQPARRNLFHVVCLQQRRPDGAQGAPLTQ
jgi:hypothetical protein